MLVKSEYPERLAKRNGIEELNYEDGIILKVGDIVCYSTAYPVRVHAIGHDGFYKFRTGRVRGFIVDQWLMENDRDKAVVHYIVSEIYRISVWRRNEVIFPYSQTKEPEIIMNKKLTNPVTQW